MQESDPPDYTGSATPASSTQEELSVAKSQRLRDHVDGVIAGWHAEQPDLAVEPIGITIPVDRSKYASTSCQVNNCNFMLPTDFFESDPRKRYHFQYCCCLKSRAAWCSYDASLSLPRDRIRRPPLVMTN